MQCNNLRSSKASDVSNVILTLLISVHTQSCIVTFVLCTCTQLTIERQFSGAVTQIYMLSFAGAKLFVSNFDNLYQMWVEFKVVEFKEIILW